MLSEKQFALRQWAQERNKAVFSRQDTIEALGFAPRTVEASIKKLVDMKRLKKIGQGQATHY